MDVPPFQLDRYHVTGLRRGHNVGEILCDRLELWLNAPTDGPSEPVDRIFIVTGEPGMGKSWFLRFVAAEGTWLMKQLEDCRSRWAGIYVDLEKRFSCPRPRAFVHSVQEGIETALSSVDRVCLCLDNVPRSRDLELEIVERELIEPSLGQDRFFLLFAQQDPERWDFGGGVPHPPPFSLDAFEEAAMRFLLDGVRCGVGTKDVIEYADGHPLFAHWLCSKGLEAGMEAFIDYSLVRRHASMERDALLEWAFPLSLVPLEPADRAVEALQAYRSSLKDEAWRENLELKRLKRRYEMRVLRELEKIGWIRSFHPASGGLFEREYHWVSRFQRCLRYLFEQRQPEAFKRVCKSIEEDNDDGS